MTAETKVVASDRVIFTPLVDGTGVLLDLDSKFYFTLNQTGVFVWKRLSAAGGATPTELVAGISDTFDVGPEQALTDLNALLDELVAESLAKRG